MTAPFMPTPFATPIYNPAIASSGAPPIPYISNAEFIFAPTGLTTNDLDPGGNAGAQSQALADVIRRATRWADSICFGSDPSSKGASLAASLTVDSATIKIKGGELRLICDYRPLVSLIGVAVGSGMSDLSSLDASIAARTRPGRRTWYIPYGGPISISRTGDGPAIIPGSGSGGRVYSVWSYVNGYPHTKLLANVAANATSCVVASTDGNGGLWGVLPASGAFPGSYLTATDGALTESVYVQSVALNTPATGKTTLTTSPFTNAHTVPAAPDFIPMSAIPDDVHQAVISLVVFLIKTRGARALVMPKVAGGRPTRQAGGEAGVFEDYETALQIFEDGGYIVRVKHPGSY
jgi:hypothetical protein